MGENGHGAPLNRWSAQFAASWQRYRNTVRIAPPVGDQKEAQPAPLPDTVADAVAEGGTWWPNITPPKLSDDMREVVSEAARIRTLQAADERAFELRWAAGVCGSPIEVVMLCALLVAAPIHFDDVKLAAGEREFHTGVRLSSNRLVIEPQAYVGDYRVDFRVTAATDLWAFDEGRRPYVADVDERSTVVECDGHDWHDRSKDQARADRERDRALQALGFRVYRYTGSEIWEDVFRGAYQVVDDLMQQVAGENYLPPLV